ncbi:flagellar hook-associated protein FlgK [Ramlibacter sp. MAHUQ-53]|uniref:flagellar hook-associated protein FlgK n=1 Tax=unclassified Ramlibacter TaxID=2617605 RepID=UPI0036442EC4
MSDLLGIASSGITAYQRALATVSNNIANVSTEGYSRQGVGQAASAPRLVGTNYLGTGTVFTGVRRQYDAFLEQNLRSSNSELQAQEPMVNYVNRLIDVMGNESIGLTTAMNQFFTAARDLATDPASSVERSVFLRDADGLAARFRQLDQQFALLETETRQTVETDVGKVNSLTRQLSQVNKELSRSATLDRQPSELLDQRDNLLRELSGLTTVKTRFESNGAVLVSVGDVIDQGVLVDGSRSYDIGVSTEDGGDGGRLRFVLDPYGNPRSLPNLLSGSIGGTVAFRDNVLAPAVDALDQLAGTLVDEVNAVHRGGLDQEARVGTDLFTLAGGARGAAGRMALAITDASRVAAAAQFRVTDDSLNVGSAQATVSWSAPRYEGSTGLVDGLAAGLSPALGQARLTIGSRQPYASLGAVPLGMEDLTLTLTNPAPGQSLQVFTRDGRHLLGTSLSGQQQADLVAAGNGMEAGATYADLRGPQSHGTASDFLGMDLFLGARAGVQQIQRFDAQTGKPLAPQPQAASLVGRAFTPLSGPLPQGTLRLNGVSLGALGAAQDGNGDGRFDASEVAAWINGQPGVGVTASVAQVTLADGSLGQALRLDRPQDDTANDIRLAAGPAGEAADLAKLGFDSALHVNGAAADDLVVFVTHAAGTSTQIDVTSTFEVAGGDMQQALRQEPIDIVFVGGGEYEIRDQNLPATVLARRTFDPDAAAIRYRGLTVSFSSVPVEGDRFTIDGNRDGIGNNQAMLALAGLEDARVTPGGLTLTEAYIEQVNQVGNMAQQASIAQQALQVVYQQAQEGRDSVSGVSLDEEAADLVRFQQAYQANAKVMQVANDLFDAILQVR